MNPANQQESALNIEGFETGQLLTTQSESQWEAIRSKDGVVFSIVEAEGNVTAVQVRLTADADLALEDDQHLTCEAVWMLSQWNQNPQRHFWLDHDNWEFDENEAGDRLYQCDVQTTYQETIELVLEALTPLVTYDRAAVLSRLVALLSATEEAQPLLWSKSGQPLFVRMIFASYHTPEHSLHCHAERDEVSQPFLLNNGYATRSPGSTRLDFEDIDAILKDYEQRLQLTMPERKHQACLALRRTYNAIAESRGSSIRDVNRARGSHLSEPYLQPGFEPDEPDEATSANQPCDLGRKDSQL